MQLMGHSKDMSERYTHISDEERIKILKSQALKLELPEKKRIELEKELLRIKSLMKNTILPELETLKNEVGGLKAR